MIKLSEGVHYELILSEEQDTNWSVRILKDEFVETVIKFHAIAINEKTDNLSFNFHVISSPNPDAHIDNERLQQYAGFILQDILDTCVHEGSAKFTDRATGEELSADEVYKNR